MNFEVDKIKLIEENSNSQFATIEVDLARSGGNTHKMPISRQAIELSAKSIPGKPVLAHYVEYKDDLGGHDPEECPVGFFEERDPIVHEKDGELWVTAKAKIWKKYFDNVMKVFEKKKGKTPVSMEMEILESEINPDDNLEHITLFSILGLTLLGVKPAIAEAEARVLSFSELKDNYYREQEDDISSDNFAERGKKELGKQENENLDTKFEKNEEVDNNKKEFALNLETLWGKIYDIITDKYPDDEYSSIYRIEGIYEEEDKKFVILQLKEKEDIYYRTDLIISEEGEVSLNEEMVELQKVYLETGNVKRFEEPEGVDLTKFKVFEKVEKEEKLEEEVKEEKEEDFEKEKCSYEVKADFEALNLSLQEETEENKNLILGLWEEKDINIVMERFLALSKECAELKVFKEARLEADKKFEVEKILSETKDDLTNEEYEEFQAEGMTCNFAELDQFANKVKAFAYKNAKNKNPKKSDNMIKMGIDSNAQKKSVRLTATDIYAEYGYKINK